MKEVLGPDAEIVKYGRLNGTNTVEAVGIVKIKGLALNGEGIPVSQLAILRLDPRWRLVLRASEDWIKNDAGYVGIDFIDDSFRISGYRAKLSNQTTDGEAGFMLDLSFLLPGGESDEGTPIRIAWNAAVGKYQEVVSNDGPVEFKPEIRQPPHRRPGR
jgi:hypothetical protein